MARKDSKSQEPEAPKPVPVRVTTLSQVAPPIINVEYWNAGDFQVVSMRTLSHWEFYSLGYEVRQPSPPIMGNDDLKRPIFDSRNPDYLKAVDDATLQRGYIRLSAALQLPKEYADIELAVPGATHAERVEAIKGLVGVDVMRQWLSVINNMAQEGEARIAGRAATFLPTGDPDLEGMQSPRLDEVPVFVSP